MANPDKLKDLPLKTKVGATLAMGGTSGVITGLVWGPQTGVEIGSAAGLAIIGFTFGGASSERAEDFALKGRKIKAYVEAIKALLESALSLGASGVLGGYAIASEPGAIVMGSLGLMAGIGNGRLAFRGVSRSLKTI